MQKILDWEGLSLNEVLTLARDVLEDPDLPTVAKWREGGGKVLGHFQVYFPEEIAHAAGMLPFKMKGFPVAPDHADSRFGSFLCSIIKTSLEVALSGTLKLDMFVTHPICDAARNLGAIFGRNFTHPSPILYLPQNPNSSHSVVWLTEEYERLQKMVEEVAGKKISQQDLAHSIALFNTNRALIRKLYALKDATPWKIAAEDAYALVALAGFVPREEHNALLEWVLPQLQSRDSREEDRVRIVFEGAFCEQPPLDLVRLLGRTTYVVDDDFLIGLRYLLEDVHPGDDPLEALAEAYINASSYSPVQHDNRKHKEKLLLGRIRNARAGAAVVGAAKMCEPGLEELVNYTHALDDAGIPHFVTEFEENMTSFSTLELQLETFVENMLFA
ncbi:2-hydroxyacyl-CoA dehydratase [bacterium]|nr:2-hydroxyacyl-CoA dehydratase [bacterium]